MKPLSATELEREILALQEMKTPALQQKWREVFKSEPPRKMRAGFLQRAIAYHLQAAAFGGLNAKTKRQLKRIAEERKQGRPTGRSNENPMVSSVRRRSLSPGTRLLREWNGRTELVDVTEDGLVWKGQTYRTLSAVAVAITGTKWSGPKFFGLSAQASASASLDRRSAAKLTSAARLVAVPA